MSRSSVLVTVIVTTVLAGIALPAAAEQPTIPLVGSSGDPDRDGRPGEDRAIRERVKSYLERHGDNGVVTSEAMLAKTRFGYERWLAKERVEWTKAIPGNGWVSLGPNNGAGRATCVVPHPTDPNTVLAGAAGGGVWKSTDSGSSWRPLTDGLVSDLSVGALAYAPSNPDVVYLGTGEGGYAIDFIPGIGLVRSDDGGETWLLPDTAIASQFYALSVDPRDADTLLAATNAGLLKSTDGGVTWAHPIPSAPGVGSGNFAATEVVRSAANPDLVYAALWCYGTCPAGHDRVMRSTDGGDAWTAAGTGLPATSTGDYSLNRNSLAVSPSNDQVLYVGLNTAPGSGDPPARVFVSSDGGASWRETTRPQAYLGVQGWYDNTITVKPTDPNTVIAGGVFYVVTQDGGSSWNTRNPYAYGGGMGTDTLPHVDAHDLEWQGGTLWLACDGGIWSSTDDGLTWRDRNAGLITRQYYGLAIDPVHRERVIAGSQDNGSGRRRDAGDNSWDDVLGGDGFECAINPLVPDYAYASVQFGLIARSLSGADSPESFVDISPGWGEEVTPFITLMTMREDQPWVVYTGGNRVWRSSDAGDSWTPLSTEVENFVWATTEVWSIAVTPADPQVVMVAKGSYLYRSANGGASWRYTSIPETAERVNNLEISPFDADVTLACIAGTAGGRLYRSGDAGATWQRSDAGLPPFAVQVARWDPTDPNTVYAGTDVGVYRSLDGGLTWEELGDGLPAASVHDIRVLPDGSMLRIATHGRGVWELDIPRDANASPEIQITAPSTEPLLNVGDELALEAVASDADGDPVSVRWVFPDDWEEVAGGSGTGTHTSSITRRFDIGGGFRVAALADDGRGGKAVASRQVYVLEPANDCATPRVLPGDGPFPLSVLTSNEYASTAPTDPNVPCASGSQAGKQGSLWFELEPRQTGTYSLSTCGSLADTVLSVWQGERCGPYTTVATGCSDDDEQVHCLGRRTDSYVEVELEQGETYRIMVGSYSSQAKGMLRLNVDCLACTPPPLFEYVVAAAAHNEGLAGTFWVTDLELHNPNHWAVTARLAFLPAGSDNTGAVEVESEVAASSSVSLNDVVATLFGATGSGAIRLNADGELVVASRTYNTAPSGTYGQFIGGESPGDGIRAGGQALLIGLGRTAETRTNLGAANTSAQAASITIELYGADGELLASRDEQLLPFGWFQLSDIFASEGLTNVPDAFAVVNNTSSTSTVLAYASVVDQRTGDPVFVTAVDEAAPSSPVWIAAAAHSAGAAGSTWRTDLALVNRSTAALTATVELFRADRDNSAHPSALVAVPAGSSVRIGDLLETSFGVSGSAALRVSVDTGSLAVSSRTYNLTPDGTYGQLIPGVGAARAVTAGQRAALVQLRRNGSFRTNLGLVNLTGGPITVTADFFAADGSPLGSVPYDLQPLAYHQDNDAIPGAADVDGAFAVVTSSTAGARFLAYASVVDNGSGDPVFIPSKVVGE